MESFKRWRNWLQRILYEQLDDLVVSRHIFHQFRQHTARYVGSRAHAELAHWMAQNYAAFVATAIRRIVEKPSRQWRSVSLRILLEDLAANHTELTRQRFCRLYKGSVAARFAERDFDRITRKKGALVLTADRIQQDIQRLERACGPVYRFVNKAIAHTEEDRRKIGKIRYGDFDRAIDEIVTNYQRYSLLITGRVCEPLVPLDLWDVADSLNRLWP